MNQTTPSPSPQQARPEQSPLYRSLHPPSTALASKIITRDVWIWCHNCCAFVIPACAGMTIGTQHLALGSQLSLQLQRLQEGAIVQAFFQKLAGLLHFLLLPDANPAHEMLDPIHSRK